MRHCTKWILGAGFDFGGDQLEGFWFAKFEASNTNGYGDSDSTANTTNLTLQVKPNVTSWRNITTKNEFTVCLNLKDKTNSNNELIYFNNKSNVDTHMMKNVEWGAVAYLTHSTYGLNKNKIGIHSASGYITGQGTTANAYNTLNSIKASTPNNVYGIYDMSGGAYEHTSACFSGKESYLTAETNQNYINKYIDIYNNSPNLKFGDAVYETSSNITSSSAAIFSWFSNRSSYIVSTNNCLIARGGRYNSTPIAGLFDFGFSIGSAYVGNGFRPVCIVY